MRRHTVVLALLALGGPLMCSCSPGGKPNARRAAQAWPVGAPWPAWAAAGTKASRVQSLTEREAALWLRWVIPMPKRVRVQGKLTLPASSLAPRLRRNATDVEQAAFKELTGLIAERTGAHCRQWAPRQLGAGFPILIGVCDARGKLDGTSIPGAGELAALPNADQAYLITPLRRNGIAVAALTERGVYYGVKTLQQLLEPHLAPNQVTLPMLAILDWPDLADRGEWGGSATRDIEYLADRKMNLIEAHTGMAIDDQGRGVATLDAKRQEEARLHAIQWVPIITHLDQIGGSGIYQRFPELKGKGKKAQGSWGAEVHAPCFSQPKTAAILADWFTSLAATKGVDDICVWLSEDHVQCECDGCKAKGQFALETEACVRAWQLARQKNPRRPLPATGAHCRQWAPRLRILLTQGSYSTNDKVLAAASPPEVRITYYDGGRTYDSSREPMIYPLLEDFARRGRWLGCYPQLTASWRIVCPWSGPQFIRYRMTEFVNKGLSCLCGYATPDNRFYDFNVTAAAEWSWDAHGRDEREFAAAWATRRRLADPEKAADWAVMLGPVGWDVYGSGIPYPHFFGHAAQIVKNRNRPALGSGMFRYFPTIEHVDNDLAACGRATDLAKQLNDPALTAETATIGGYVRMVKAIYTIANTVAGKQKLDAAETQTVQTALDELDRAGASVGNGMLAWKAAVAPDCTASRFMDTVDVTNDTVGAIAAALVPLGVKDTGKPYRSHKIGGWATTDFDEKEDVQKKWDVTDSVDGPGTYCVRFEYTRGWAGLAIQAVALAVQKQGASQPAEVVADRHDGTAANENKANVYRLQLASHDPGSRYLILANIKGTSSKGKPVERQGCEGAVWMAKDRP